MNDLIRIDIYGLLDFNKLAPISSLKNLTVKGKYTGHFQGGEMFTAAGSFDNCEIIDSRDPNKVLCTLNGAGMLKISLDHAVFNVFGQFDWLD